MKELSIFVDESGDFGPYYHLSPYYIVLFVFHDQSIDISKNIKHLNESLRQSGLPETPIHTGPIIRRENEYDNFTLLERKRIFNFLYNFTRTTEITFKSLVVEKKQLVDDLDLHVQLTKQFTAFFKDNTEWFLKYDRIIVYYDYGQRELARILVTLFSTHLSNSEFYKGAQLDYKLFQVADMLCTLELLTLKADRKNLSNSELTFFKSAKALHKSYLKAIQSKRL